ncbi:helix-turn-helix domain-containing protein [Streptomyces sp. NBC_01276]
MREHALVLLRRGESNRSVAERLDVPRGTVGRWRHEDRKHRGETYIHPTDCPMCTDHPLDRSAYAYLLGLYLGDGHIISKHKQHHLSVFCDAAWTGLIDAAEEAMHRVMPLSRISRRQRQGCVEVKSYTQHWKRLFPQHPWAFVRGLIHSDGCRTPNRTVRNGKRYEYPRCFFTNRSTDITSLLTRTLDLLGVEWRRANEANVSIARKESVALMDAHIGPKY